MPCKKKYNFAVLILSHGRAGNIATINTLRKDGYTGKVYIVIDDEDEQADKYYSLYGDSVVQFSKDEMRKTTDTMDIKGNEKIVVYARNKCFDIAKALHLDYFLELDDDYKSFQHRYEDGGKLKEKECKNLDKIFSSMIDFLNASGAITVAFAQGGDSLGGLDSKRWRDGMIRKAMNTFFCKTDRPFKFLGRINEDTNMYLEYGKRGALCFTIMDLQIVQAQTQKQKGGLTDIYLDCGTYQKSFYSVMINPSCVKVAEMGLHRRLHHNILWDYAVPKIIDCKYKKG